ncbi:ATP-dependent endonuclease [Thioalkalivibrio sp. ALE14]|uniref:ATP-dependent nuclease n=1 Tax=Thioalkalivibrio sp. ALE14 TaxID=1158168 RepID=UPI00036909F1|nr:AAA family ATPase [Thioalkalivibrio sp. ALE14]
MKITGFDIKNFKGVNAATVKFRDSDAARVHTLVGLNESGKTTLLEAMHSFSPDGETELVVKSAGNLEEQREQWVPRDKISIFTGEVSVAAHVAATAQDWLEFEEQFKAASGLDCDPEGFRSEFTVRLVHKYRNGDYRETVTNVNLPEFRVKTPRARKFRTPASDETKTIGRTLRSMLPTVAYYPTFVFDFPKKIYLTGRDTSARNRFYRQLFQDILDYDQSGYTIEESILARLHKKETQGVWENWFSSFVGTTEEDKVKQVIARAEQAVTRLVFSKWNEVFGEKVGAKEIAIDLQYEKGRPVETPEGGEEEPTVHDAYIRFRVKDGASLFSVEDRSLGFRWFFSFLLFTQFRIHRDAKRPTLFLFDEPASNLHAAAQKKLLESFPAIARPPHRLIYSTHSHYMVEPRWLEQAYIVFDKNSVPDHEIIDDSVRADSSVDIQAVPYRKFVNERPQQTSYFQPILDTLEVQPSHFDYRTGGLIVEGKSDYYVLRLCCIVLGEDIGPIFPANGSGAMGALVALHRGWALPVRVLFDGDQGGKDGKRKLAQDFAVAEEESITLSDLDPRLMAIESIFSENDKDQMVAGATGNPKTVMLRRVQGMIASGEVPAFTEETRGRMRAAVDGLKQFIAE